METTHPRYEIGIIGGGPAGSSLACYLAQGGISCILLEKEEFPRPHVGESLVPASNRVLSEINLLEEVDRAGFVRKYGAAWTADSARTYSMDFKDIPEDCEVDIRFNEQEMDTDKNYTFHVDRAKFDELILRHAEKSGAKVIEKALVQKVHFEEEAFPVIIYKKDGKKTEVPVRLVVDASGRSTKLGGQLNLKVKDDSFDQVAIHAWFEGYSRGSEENSEFIFIHFLPVSNSWVWQIPITDTITSFGVVTQKENFTPYKDRRADFFWEYIDYHPKVGKRLKEAKQIRPFKTEGDYSYSMKKLCGDGWVLIGDAARFVDPIFSSGVSVALNSARFLFHDIKAFYQKGEKDFFKKEDLKQFEKTLAYGINNWYRFISLYYRLNLIFTRFVSNPKYRPEILRLLSGDVYDEHGPKVLDEMEKFIHTVEQTENHILHPLLVKLRGQEFNPSKNQTPSSSTSGKF